VIFHLEQNEYDIHQQLSFRIARRAQRESFLSEAHRWMSTMDFDYFFRRCLTVPNYYQSG
jgi:hypothetical protein